MVNYICGAPFCLPTQVEGKVSPCIRYPVPRISSQFQTCCWNMVKENLKYHFYMQGKFLTSVQSETSQQHTVPELEYKKIHHSTQLSSFILSNGEKIQGKKNITWETADDPISKSLLYNPAPRLNPAQWIYIHIHTHTHTQNLIFCRHIFCKNESFSLTRTAIFWDFCQSRTTILCYVKSQKSAYLICVAVESWYHEFFSYTICRRVVS